MTTLRPYVVRWRATGEATVLAASPRDAGDRVSSDVLRWAGDLEWETSLVESAQPVTVSRPDVS